MKIEFTTIRVVKGDTLENVCVLSKDELIGLLTDAIHWGVGTYQEQLKGGSPTNTQIQYYLSEKLS